MRRHKHRLSNYRLWTGNFGQLIPVGVTEILPGDTFRHRTSALVRVTPMAAPVMHPVNVRIHHWFVPSRLLWDGWEDFITKVKPTSESPLPTVTVPAAASPSALLDHLGIPPEAEGKNLLAFPVRAYNHIYNQKYRDQDIHTERAIDDLTLAQSVWAKDYFTTARSEPQKGPAIKVPISGGNVPVTGIGHTNQTMAGAQATVWETGQSGSKTYQNYKALNDGSVVAEEDPNNTGVINVRANLAGGDLGILINDMREAYGKMRIAEARNRFGSRYVDYLRFYGIEPSDGRLAEPEYCGGGKQTVAFSEVLSTAEAGQAKVGSLAGHGLAAMRTRPYRKFFEEHGWLVSLATIRPVPMYMQAINRMWLRKEPDDFWHKELEVMGMQSVAKAELYAAHPNDSDVWGYVDRFREYREVPSMVTGDFRKSTFDYWHLARKFASSPALNPTFLDCNPDARIFQDTNVPQFQVMTYHQIAARRLVARKARTS